MNGKQAKRLRKLADTIAKSQGLPDLMYVKEENRKAVFMGGKTVWVPIIIYKLAACRRKVYKQLKREYKMGVPVYD